MRLLTVHQPWAGAIVHRGKDVENRVRNIAGDYRGPVAIHVALRHNYEAVAAHNAIAEHLDEHSVYGYGCIIGVVDLVDVHRSGDCYQQSIINAIHAYKTDAETFYRLPITNGAGGIIGRADFCSKWALGESWHLVLANPRPLSEPIPYKGALGLLRLPDDVAELVRQAVAS